MRSLLALVSLAACGGSPAPTPTTTPVAATPAPAPTATPAAAAPAPTPAPPSTTPAPQPSVSNAPEITRSAGVAGGVVVLWPRIPGHAKDPDARALAAKVQDRLRAIAARAYPGKPIDVRPEPERACGRQGCTAIAVGAALIRNAGGCAVIATVAAGGTSPTTIVPWVGQLEVKTASVPFREPPEPAIVIHDYESCGDVEQQLAAREAPVEAAIRAGK